MSQTPVISDGRQEEESRWNQISGPRKSCSRMNHKAGRQAHMGGAEEKRRENNQNQSRDKLPAGVARSRKAPFHDQG